MTTPAADLQAAVEMIRRICPPHLDRDAYGRLLARRFAAHRAAVLREAADAVLDLIGTEARLPQTISGVHRASDRLRRMADEAQPETQAHQHVWATVPASGAYGRLIGHTWTYCGICGQPPATNQPDDDATEEATR